MTKIKSKYINHIQNFLSRVCYFLLGLHWFQQIIGLLTYVIYGLPCLLFNTFTHGFTPLAQWIWRTTKYVKKIISQATFFQVILDLCYLQLLPDVVIFNLVCSHVHLCMHIQQHSSCEYYTKSQHSLPYMSVVLCWLSTYHNPPPLSELGNDANSHKLNKLNKWKRRELSDRVV